jgi:hypothetical protein
MNIDYSRLGHRSRGLCSCLKVDQKEDFERKSQFKVVDAEALKFHFFGTEINFTLVSFLPFPFPKKQS